MLWLSEIIFWICAALVLYVYVGFPFLLALLGPGRRRDSAATLETLPRVTLLISAYNERRDIAAKMENSLSLRYPAGRLEILVVSDCSNDGTDEIVLEYASRGVKLLRQSQRLGKSAGLNVGVAQARGELLVFSDANAMYDRDALLHLIRPFADPRVGYVVGNARYAERDSTTPSAQSESLYWKYETWLKQRESAFHSVIGGDGAIYAIRRELFTQLRPTDINDFVNPLQIINRGYLGVFEPSAICYEEAAATFRQEFRRKVRIISRSLNALLRVPAVLNPFRNFRHWFLLISHKLLRWLAPLFLLLLLASSLLLWSVPFYRLAAFLQIGFYGLALLGLAWETGRGSLKILQLPFYFCVVNSASLLGCVKCLRRDLSGTWTPPRHPAQEQPRSL